MPPERIIDYLALMGDAVDNVPGVDKVGPKTACKLIEQYGSLEGVIAHADEVKGVVGENLRKAHRLAAHRAHARHREDRRRAALRDGVAASTRAPTTRSWSSSSSASASARCATASLNKEDAPEKGDARRRPPTPTRRSAPPARARGEEGPQLRHPQRRRRPGRRRHALRRHAQLRDGARRRGARALGAKLEAAPLACIDTETTSLDPMLAELVGISLSARAGRGRLHPAHAPLRGRARAAADCDQVLARLKPWLEDAAKAKVGQNTKYDRQVFANYGIAARGFVHDTLLQSYVLQSHQRHDMDALATRFLGASGAAAVRRRRGQGRLGRSRSTRWTSQRAAAYSAEDADVTLQLHGALWPRVERDAKLKRIYAEIEIPVSRRAARDGAQRRADRHAAALAPGPGAGPEDARARSSARTSWPAARSTSARPSSSAEILFDRMELKVVKKTPSGAPSTDEEVLEKLAEDHPLCPHAARAPRRSRS